MSSYKACDNCDRYGYSCDGNIKQHNKACDNWEKLGSKMILVEVNKMEAE